jgi:hypothetical protein
MEDLEKLINVNILIVIIMPKDYVKIAISILIINAKDRNWMMTIYNQINEKSFF